MKPSAETTLHDTPAHGSSYGLRRLLGLAAAAAGLLLAAAAPASAQSATQFSLVGRGWGHGIGMSQWGAYGYAQHGFKYDAIIKHYYTGVTLGKVSNSTIRVLLAQDKTTLSVTATSGFSVAAGSARLALPAGSTAVVSWVDGKYRVVAGSASKSFTSPIVFSPGSSRLKLLNKNDNGEILRYRGNLRVIHYTDGFSAINRLPLESYLGGVVPREVGSSWPAEALKAQAVAARSYAARSIGGSGAFDVYCTTRSQMYGGVEAEATSTNAAIAATKGVVPRYDGQVIMAFFFSTSGGHTENIENVWATSPLPYLKGVDDPYEPGAPTAKYHIWPDNPIRKSASSVAGALGAYSTSNLSGVKGTLRGIYVVKRGVSPRVVKAYLIGSSGTTAISGSTLRAKLDLRDTWVSFTSLSINPAASENLAITYGASFPFSGRIYPALAAGAEVTLHYYRNGVWQTTTLTTTRGTLSLGDGFMARYSDYALTGKPGKTTEYYVSSRGYQSPHTTVSVRPAFTIAATPTTAAAGGKITISGTAKPVAATTGRPVYLQTKSGDKWTDAGSVTLNSVAHYSFSWTAVAGVTAVRVRMNTGSGLYAGNSAAVTVTIN